MIETTLAPLNLARTAAALEAYDQARIVYDSELAAALGNPAMAVELGAAVDAALNRLWDTEKAVGVAFAADTADRNDPDTAKRALPGDWLRGMVARWQAGEFAEADTAGAPTEVRGI